MAITVIFSSTKEESMGRACIQKTILMLSLALRKPKLYSSISKRLTLRCLTARWLKMWLEEAQIHRFNSTLQKESKCKSKSIMMKSWGTRQQTQKQATYQTKSNSQSHPECHMIELISGMQETLAQDFNSETMNLILTKVELRWWKEQAARQIALSAAVMSQKKTIKSATSSQVFQMILMMDFCKTKAKDTQRVLWREWKSSVRGPPKARGSCTIAMTSQI